MISPLPREQTPQESAPGGDRFRPPGGFGFRPGPKRASTGAIAGFLPESPQTSRAGAPQRRPDSFANTPFAQLEMS